MEVMQFENYVFATPIAKQHGKKISNWLGNGGTKKLIKVLSDKLGDKVVITKQGGIAYDNQGTWLHTELYPYFERWLNTQHVRYEFTRDEEDFKSLLQETFEGILEFEYQKKIEKYYIDFYCDKYKLAVEYDEVHHNKKEVFTKDEERQNYLNSKYGITFIRVVQGKEQSAINKIIKQTMGLK